MSRKSKITKGFEVPKDAKIKEDIIKPIQIIEPKQNAIIAFIVFAFVMVIYQMTNSPSLAFWDAGEYATTAKIFSVLHAPGNPTYVIFGRFINILGLGMSTPQVISFFSSLSGALAVMFTYLYTIKLVSMFEKRVNVAVPIGIIAAFLTAFSFTFWTNSVEAEVYSGLAFFINFIIYLLLVWLQKSEDLSHQNYLIFIIYLFFLGFGLHQTVLQIAPAVLLIAVFPLIKPYLKKDGFYIQLVYWVIGLFVFYFVMDFKFSSFSQPLFALATVSVLMYYLRGRVNSTAWILAVIVLIIGFSTHLYIPIRASFRPFINEGDPQTWERFMAFFNREQFGKNDIFTRNTTFLSGQMGTHFFRYFNWQFFNTEMLSKWLSVPQVIFNLLLIPATYLLGLFGIYFQFKKNKTSFIYLFSLFFMASIAMVFVMNIPLDTPRPRDYFFVTAYNLWATFMAIGLVYGLKVIFKSKKLYPLVMVIAFMVPTVTLISQYYHVDRSKEYYAAEYGMNFLNSLEENAIIFTNGDNDTFPLWYAQAVDDPYILANQPDTILPAKGVNPDSNTKAQIAMAMDFKNRECLGIRKDVSVANYSLMNTPWYIRQLRDREGINFSIHDSQIEELITPERFERPVTYNIPYNNSTVRFTVEKDDLSLGYWRGQDKATMQIIKDNLGKRPIYFASTVGGQFLGLDDHLEDHVMVYKLNPGSALYSDSSAFDIYVELLENIYVVNSIMDTTTYKDEVVARLTAPYIGHYSRLAETYLRMGKHADAIRNFERANQIFLSIKETAKTDIARYGIVVQLGYANALISIAEDTMIQNKREDAPKYYANAISILESLTEMSFSQYNEYQVAVYLALGDAYMGLADIGITQNKPEEAIEYYQKAQEVYESFGNNTSVEIKENLIYNYLGLAETYANLDNFTDARKFYQKANQVLLSMGNNASPRMKQIGQGIQRNILKLEDDAN